MEEPSTRRRYWRALGQTKKDFDSARKTCALDGGDLAVMETEQLWEFVKNNLGYAFLIFLSDLNNCVSLKLMTYEFFMISINTAENVNGHCCG